MADKYKADGYGPGVFYETGFVHKKYPRKANWFTCGFVLTVMLILIALFALGYGLDFIIQSPVF